MRWTYPEVFAKRDLVIILVTGVFTLFWGYTGGFTDDMTQVAVCLFWATVLMFMAGYPLFRDNVPKLAAGLAIFAWFILYMIINTRASYITQSATFPFVDAPLAAIDELFGLNAKEIVQFTGSNKLLSDVSHFVYAQTGPLAYLGFIVLAVKGDTQRLRNTMSILTLGGIGTIVIACILPAAGAYPYYGVTLADVGFLAGRPIGDMHVEHVMALREGSMRAIPVEMKGLVTFPSFHVIYALAGAYALATTRILGPLAAIFTAAVAYSTVPVGGHFVIDIVGGIAVWYLIVRYVHWMERAPVDVSRAQPVPAASA